MTVKELVEELSQYDPLCEVGIRYLNGNILYDARWVKPIQDSCKVSIVIGDKLASFREKNGQGNMLDR